MISLIFDSIHYFSFCSDQNFLKCWSPKIDFHPNLSLTYLFLFILSCRLNLSSLSMLLSLYHVFHLARWIYSCCWFPSYPLTCNPITMNSSFSITLRAISWAISQSPSKAPSRATLMALVIVSMVISKVLTHSDSLVWTPVESRRPMNT